MSSPNSETPSPKNKNLKTVSPPLSKTRLSSLIYALVILTALLTAYYGYRIVQWKHPSIIPRGPPKASSTTPSCPSGSGGTVEGRINALAEALGMPSKDLAIAIAGAVREYVPPASLSAVKERETGSEVLEELFKEREGTGAPPAEETKSGVVDGVLSGVDSFVGMDEP